VVVARMIGMLVGVAALSAFGLYRFQQILRTMPRPTGDPFQIKDQIAANYQNAYAIEYGQIFWITMWVCLVGAVLGLFIGGRQSRHADEDDAAPEREPAVR
jgi:hypothetical protein